MVFNRLLTVMGMMMKSGIVAAGSISSGGK
jgi:hypothetical protein